jgi:hypothetical protein
MLSVLLLALTVSNSTLEDSTQGRVLTKTTSHASQAPILCPRIAYGLCAVGGMTLSARYPLKPAYLCC